MRRFISGQKELIELDNQVSYPRIEINKNEAFLREDSTFPDPSVINGVTDKQGELAPVPSEYKKSIGT